MKLGKKILSGLFAITFIFTGSCLGYQKNTVYADEVDAEYEIQRKALVEAVNDRANVISTEAFYSYASENSKAIYEKAVADAEAVLELGHGASFDQMSQATEAINTAKQNIIKEVNHILTKRKLERVLEKVRATNRATKFILEKYPNTIAKVRPEIEALLQKQDRQIREAEKRLQNM
uniref:FIVAR domain-containing protein n=1 Tax=Anaerococcus mediterraneensis TaxID=1870984 RepID=UPI0009315FCB|nr:FIVAR domain-containing protein [Anaerococcus mediterraneensis]